MVWEGWERIQESSLPWKRRRCCFRGPCRGFPGARQRTPVQGSPDCKQDKCRLCSLLNIIFLSNKLIYIIYIIYMREKSNQNGENFKGIQYCKLLLSYSNQSTAGTKKHTFILFILFDTLWGIVRSSQYLIVAGSGSYCYKWTESGFRSASYSNFIYLFRKQPLDLIK